MLQSLAVTHYRSLLQLSTHLEQLNLITGANGSGKSNLYRALRLLAETAQGGVINALAREGGLPSTLWAGPEVLSRTMRQGQVPVQGGPRREPVRLRLGFAGEDYSYAITLGLPEPSSSAFTLDPEIKHEAIWVGEVYRPASVLVERQGALLKRRHAKQWSVVSTTLSPFESLFNHAGDPQTTPEVFHLREQIRSWRFYDHFRSDANAPCRRPQLGTRTPALHHDGRDLAAALQTILEIGNHQALEQAIDDAFPGASISVQTYNEGRFAVQFQQQGLLRPLSAAELSDGTLRYLLWTAALLTPRPPALMILNEPETSLHPDLLPALARLIAHAAQRTQIWVVSHANRLIQTLEQSSLCHTIVLNKQLGATQISGQRQLDQPPWRWPE